MRRIAINIFDTRLGFLGIQIFALAVYFIINKYTILSDVVYAVLFNGLCAARLIFVGRTRLAVGLTLSMALLVPAPLIMFSVISTSEKLLRNDLLVYPFMAICAAAFVLSIFAYVVAFLAKSAAVKSAGFN